MMTKELNKCKTELQYWRSRSPAVPPLCAECGAALRLSPPAIQWAASSSETNEVETASSSKVVDLVVELKEKESKEQERDSSKESKDGRDKDSNREPGDASTPPARRRASADATTPDRKKRRLTRPRKL